MRILLVHPDDDPAQGPWAGQSWDSVIDLGLAGVESYRRWSAAFRCPVNTAPKLGQADFDEIRAILSTGLGGLVDKHGLDWWDLLALEFHPQLERLMRLRRLAERFGTSDEIFVSRPGFETQILSILGRKVTSFPPRNVLGKKLRRYARVFSNLSTSQILQIAGDKYDPGYRVRRLIARPTKTCSHPVVLLPSAYVNVSRTELQYAEMLPDCDFLLIATRPSGRVETSLPNVSVADLAAYAHGKTSIAFELEGLLKKWSQLERDLAESSSSSVAIRAGILDPFPKMLQDGLLTRDAWLQAFGREAVQAVLSADDANMATRVPLEIALKRGLPAVSCHHGALDGRHRMRPKREHLFLAKGEMERDYLVRECGFPSEQIEIAGPPTHARPRREPSAKRSAIVFFSEPYEVFGGRYSEIYREILPRLASIAEATSRELILKLHPFENERTCTRIARTVLNQSQQTRLRVVAGRLTGEMLEQTWFALTILSTAALECVLAGVPMFLCEWLDYSQYGYLQQFVRYRVGIGLEAADQIANIPALVETVWPNVKTDLWQVAEPGCLRGLVTGEFRAAAAV